MKIRSILEYYTPDQAFMRSDDLLDRQYEPPVQDESPVERKQEVQQQHQIEVSRHQRKLGPSTIDHVKVGDTIEFTYDVDQEAIVQAIKFSRTGRKIFVVRAYDGDLVDNVKGTLLDVPASMARLK